VAVATSANDLVVQPAPILDAPSSPPPAACSRAWWPAWSESFTANDRRIQLRRPPARPPPKQHRPVRQPAAKAPPAASCTLPPPPPSPLPLPMAPPSEPDSITPAAKEPSAAAIQRPVSSASAASTGSEDLLPHLMSLLLPAGTAEPPLPSPAPAPPDPPPSAPSPAVCGSPGAEEWGWGDVIAGLGSNGPDASAYDISGASRHEEEPATLAQAIEEEWFWGEEAAEAAAVKGNAQPTAATTDGGDLGWRPVMGVVPDDFYNVPDDVWPPTDAAGAVAPPPRAETPNDLTNEEKISVLTLDYPSFSKEELQAALDGSNGRLEDAMRLLASFLDEDSAATQRQQTERPSTADVLRLVEELEAEEQKGMAAAAAVPAPVDPMTAQLDALAAKFPDMERDGLMVSLELASFDVEAAERVLRDQMAAEEAPPPAPLPLAGDAAPVPFPPRRMSETARNQEIYEQERANADRLRTAYRQLESQARHAADRGDYHLVDSLNVRANEINDEYYKASDGAARRIALRVNRGKKGFMTVDLHGLHVDEALYKITQALDTLPSISPGGVVVRYVAGKGNHSGEAGAQIKPAVLALLEERGVHYSAPADKGHVDVIIEGTA
jgi:hypothetical protein